MKKLERKLDSVFWFLVALLPVITYIVMYVHAGSTVDFAAHVSGYRFAFLADIFADVFKDNIAMPTVLIDYLSYFCSVEIARILIGIVIFLPRFARTFMEGIYEKIGR